MYRDHFYFGCSGWSYVGWIGKFYPMGSRSNKFLSMYSNTYDSVEVDSTYYSTPSVKTLSSWYESTSKNFKFCPKLNRTITHDNLLSNSENNLKLFVNRMRLLHNKLGPILIQLPPFLKYDPYLLEDFINLLPKDLEFAIEFRDNSWLCDRTESLLQSHNIVTVWSDSPFTKKALRITGNFIYLRLVGDRSIDESKFGTVQRERDTDITRWAEIIRNNEGRVAYIFANNHYEGFSPHTVELFKEKLGLTRSTWPIDNSDNSDKNQTTLF